MFGCSTIRKFSNDVSGQKKVAARDYEDMLQVHNYIAPFFHSRKTYVHDYPQCSLAAFDGILPDEHHAEEKIIMDTLFDFSVWHAFAKSRMHTESSLRVFDSITTSLGQQLRRFSKHVCLKFTTKETPAEMASHVRCNANTAKNSKSSVPSNPATTSLRKGCKGFNLFTYKFHSLGDYFRTILLFGTTNLYSTQIVRLFFYCSIVILSDLSFY